MTMDFSAMPLAQEWQRVSIWLDRRFVAPAVTASVMVMLITLLAVAERIANLKELHPPFLWRRQKECRDVHCAMPKTVVQLSCNVWRIRDTLQWICLSRSPLQPSDDLILDLVVGSLRNDLARNQLRLVRVGPAVDDPFRVGVPNAGQ
jgi:hypothetical protein